VNQRPAADRRREQERDLGFAERERRAPPRQKPVERGEHRQRQRTQGRDDFQPFDRKSIGQRRSVSTSCPFPPRAWRKHEENVGATDDGADEVFRLLEPQDARNHRVLERHRPQIEQRVDGVAHGATPPIRRWRE
jgi:hypothetical protein